MFVTSALPARPYPGSVHVEAELKAAADSGDKVVLSAADAMAILGEMQRLREQNATADRLLRCVADGRSCWASTAHGLEVCEVPGVGEFLAGSARRKRWWKR